MVTNPRCRVIQASEFKARCLALMDEAAATGEVFVITKNGKPVAELRAYQGERAPSPFGLHPDTKILGDIISPLDPADWNVLA
ncbi:MAG: type II toxin-antitoxin system Phd/YefM family antitoxin [Casimicrobiaceae bacterium]|nr:type II toxin-antitoxin system Phd/YefM family antitoxin [Casimicrobiaceae bacterium]